MDNFSETTVEDAALAWLEAIGYAIAHGPELAPEQSGSERVDFGQVVLEERLKRALVLGEAVG